MCTMEGPGTVTFVLDILRVLSSAFRRQLPGLVWHLPTLHAQDEVPKCSLRGEHMTQPPPVAVPDSPGHGLAPEMGQGPCRSRGTSGPQGLRQAPGPAGPGPPRRRGFRPPPSRPWSPGEEGRSERLGSVTFEPESSPSPSHP